MSRSKSSEGVRMWGVHCILKARQIFFLLRPYPSHTSTTWARSVAHGTRSLELANHLLKLLSGRRSTLKVWGLFAPAVSSSGHRSHPPFAHHHGNGSLHRWTNLVCSPILT